MCSKNDRTHQAYLDRRVTHRRRGRVLRQLPEPRTITALWESCRQIGAIGTFHRFVLALDLLYILGTIELKEGQIIRTQP